MGKYHQGLIGEFSGKVGPVIGSSWKGIGYMRGKSRKIKGRKVSSKTEIQRAKFKLATNFMKTIRDLLPITFPDATNKMTARNNALANVLQQAVTGEFPDLRIEYSKVFMASGTLSLTMFPAATSSEAGIIKFTWQDGTGYGNAKPADKPILIAFCESLNSCFFIVSNTLRTAETASLNVKLFSCQTAVTEDGIIVSAYTTNQCSDRTQTIQVAAKAESISGQTYTDILADSGYASYDNYEEFENQNKNVYIPDQQMNMEAEKAQNPYHRNHFVYNKEDNCFICPENKILPFYSTSVHKRIKQRNNIYICKDCPACEKQSLCTKGKYRQICIEQREWMRKKIRERLNSIEGKMKYLMRMRIESVFGNIKHNLSYVHLYVNPRHRPYCL